MVLCKYFLDGNCRFGSKCNNEHLDIKQIVRSDVDMALNGKQWPFSCYGPFKDKGCVPNFIEDQSFEEMRFLCYNAKRNNYFEQFHHQFAKEAVEVKNKMKALQLLTQEVIDVISKLYDAPPDKPLFSLSHIATIKDPQFNRLDGSEILNTHNRPSLNFFNPTANINSQNIFATNNTFGSASAQNQDEQPMNNTLDTNFTFNLQQPSTTNTSDRLPGENIFKRTVEQSQSELGSSSQIPAFGHTALSSTSTFNSMQTELLGGANNFGQQSNIFRQAQTRMDQYENVFPSVAPTSNQFQQQQGISNNAIISQQLPLQYSLYSTIKDLTEEEIQAFTADRFTLTLIPISPPPKEFIN